MKTDIVLAGVGGQGILTIAACIGLAAVSRKLQLKQAEVHGMSQRGGAVQSNLRLSDSEIFSDLIPLGEADLIIAVEPMESLRYLPWLSSKGWLITNTTPVKNISNYPEETDVLNEIKKVQNSLVLNADKIAREAGSLRSSNIVVLGAASHFIDCLSNEDLESAISTLFYEKGSDIIDINIQAYRAGRAYAQNR